MAKVTKKTFNITAATNIDDKGVVLSLYKNKTNMLTLKPTMFSMFSTNKNKTLRSCENADPKDFLLMEQIYDMLGVFHLRTYLLIVNRFKESKTHNIQDFLFDNFTTNGGSEVITTFITSMMTKQLVRATRGLRLNGEKIHFDKKVVEHLVAESLIDFTNHDNGIYNSFDYFLMYMIQHIVKVAHKTSDFNESAVDFDVSSYHIDLKRFLEAKQRDLVGLNDKLQATVNKLDQAALEYMVAGNFTLLHFNVAKLLKVSSLDEIFDAIITPAEMKSEAMAKRLIDEEQARYDHLPVFDYNMEQMPINGKDLSYHVKVAKAVMQDLQNGDYLHQPKTPINRDYNIVELATEQALQKFHDEINDSIMETSIEQDFSFNLKYLLRNLRMGYKQEMLPTMIQFIGTKHYNSKMFRSHIIDGNSWEGIVNEIYSYLHKKKFVDNYSGVYYSINSFNNFDEKKRKVENVRGINAFYLDLDVAKALKKEYKSMFMSSTWEHDEEKAQMALDLTKTILKLIRDTTKMPAPTSVVMTGHGLQLIWSFNESTPVLNDKFRKLMVSQLKKMNEYVHDQIIVGIKRNIDGVDKLHKYFGPSSNDIAKMLDTTVFDIARYLRLPLTYNDKSEDGLHKDVVLPLASHQPSAHFNNLIDLMKYLHISKYNQQYSTHKNGATKRKTTKLTNNQKLKMLEENYSDFNAPIKSVDVLTKAENDKPRLDIKMMLSHNVESTKPIKSLTASHLSKNDAKKLMTAKHRSTFTCTRKIDNNFVLLGKVDPANVNLNVLGQTIHTAKSFAKIMKKVYQYGNLTNQTVNNILPFIDNNSAKSTVINSSAIEAVFGQTYYAQTNLVRLIEAMPNVIKYWNATQLHYRNNALLLVANLMVGLEQYRLVLPNVDELKDLSKDLDNNFDKIQKLLADIQAENNNRYNNWKLALRKFNVRIFSELTVTDNDNNTVGALDDSEFESVLNSYNYVERATMALSRGTFGRKIGLPQGQTDEWYVARGLSAFLDPYKNNYRNPINSFGFNSKQNIGIDGVRFNGSLSRELKNAMQEGFYFGLSEEQAKQEVVYQLMVPFLYAKPKNDRYAKQIEKLVKKEQEKKFAIETFMSNEVLNYGLHDKLNNEEFAQQVHGISRGAYYRNLKLAGGKEVIAQAYRQLQLFVEQLDTDDFKDNEVATFESQQLINATQHAESQDVNNIINVGQLTDNNLVVISELMRNVIYANFVKKNNWKVKVDVQFINQYMNDYIDHLYLATKLSNQSLQYQHNIWLAEHYELFNYLYSLNQANKDGINYLIQKDLKNPEMSSEMKKQIKSIANKLNNSNDNQVLQQLNAVHELVLE